jgi:hypothetical protein
MQNRGNVHFHSPCFDGIISAGLIMDWLERTHGWKDIVLHVVNYHLRDTWLKTPLPTPSAVVDFLYHPDALYWADHHPTTFLVPTAEQDYLARQNRDFLIYDKSAGSCAGLLARTLPASERWKDAVAWAEKIDAARYESVEEAILGDAPALQIGASLTLNAHPEYCGQLVLALRHSSLAEVANLADVRERYLQVRAQTQAGLDRFRAAACLTDDNVVVFDIQADDVLISRYAPFLYFRDARYSVGAMRGRHGAKITAMRNPWREFPSVHLGNLCVPLGGGGHHRVGSIALPKERENEVPSLLESLQSALRENAAAPEAKL